MACSSRQVSEFVKWIQQQDFYSNTTIVVTGDHLTMDSDFCDGVDDNYKRKVYTVYINADATSVSAKREYTTYDNFPTTLATLGVQIEGDRLGLGTNLFSSIQTLVEEALKKIRPGMQILDMCTGSGCILESILKFAERKGICVSGTGCDISEEALKVAKENDSRLQTGAVFIQGDLFENIAETYDMIVSNPPYIRTEEISSLEDEVKLHDPWIALDGKTDGLYFYRLIVKESVKHIKKGGYLLFETGFDQGKDVSVLLEEQGYEEIQVKKDLAGLDRVVMGRYNKE